MARLRRSVQPPTPDITVTIRGNLRYWVAEALFASVKVQVEAENLLPRRQRALAALRKPRLSIADELRELAAEISDPAIDRIWREDDGGPHGR